MSYPDILILEVLRVSLPTAAFLIYLYSRR